MNWALLSFNWTNSWWLYKQKGMWVDNRVSFEIENRERDIERHREAAKIGLSYTDFRVQWCFFCLLLDVDEPMKCFLLITSMKRRENSFYVNIEKRAFCNDKNYNALIKQIVKQNKPSCFMLVWNILYIILKSGWLLCQNCGKYK